MRVTIRHTMLVGAVLAAAPAASAAVPDALRAGATLVERVGCRECHTPDGVASDSRLVFPEPGAPEKAFATFAEDLLDLVDRDAPEQSRLFRKPTKRLKHAGGLKVVPGTADEGVLRAFVQALAAKPEPRLLHELWGTGGVVAMGRPAFRRLTASQFDNTVRDLLGDRTSPSRRLPPEDFVDGFKNQVPAQASSPILIEGYSAVAQELADAAVRSLRAGDPHKVVPCRTRDTACRDRFVRAFGRRAFRRPPTSPELARYTTLFSRQRDFSEGVRAVIETMLQSPSFLYITEGNDTVSRRYARASRLAYFLWNTMPDEALMNSAARGELDSTAGIETTARKMLQSPLAVAAVDEFVLQWLRFDRVLEAYKDRKAFPEFSRTLAVAMAEETRRFVADLVWKDQRFLDLFTADYTFANADLAGLYGLRGVTGDFQKVRYDAASERGGILGHASLLAGTSKPLETSPTARGLFVREHFLCQKVPPPPPGVDVALPPAPPGRPATNRERLAAHLRDETCSGCHGLIDSIGFGFERFDAIGRHQQASEVNTAGDVLGIADAAFSNPKQLGVILAGSSSAQQCVTKQVFRYAMGRLEGPADREILGHVLAEFRGSDWKFKELLVSLVKWMETGYAEGRS